MKVFRRSILLLAVLALVSAGATPVLAQMDQSRLTGTVTDAQGAVLPGVTVTATSPRLIGVQTAVTESEGAYRFPSLPAGMYTLLFELAGFQTLRREGIVLALGTTINVDAQLPVATLQETVTVTGESPIIDIESTKVGAEFTAEKLASIPSATDIWATLGQAPGVRMLGFDVGGSHKSQQSGYESFGIRNQNRVLSDGIDTTEGVGGAGFYADFFVNEEISVSAAGGDVEMNTPGSAVVQTIKSGGNTFKALANLSYEPGRFVGNNLDDDTQRLGYTGQPNLIFWEGHADVGGPIKRDKIWFFGAVNHFKIDKIISGVPAQFSDLGIFDNYTGKGTWKASQKDTIIGYYQWGRKYKPRRGLSNVVGPDSVLAQDSKSWVYKGEHQRVWTNRLFTDTRLGLFGFGWPMAPQVPFATNPPRVDLGTGVESGAGWLQADAGGPFTFDRNKPQFNFTATYYLPDKMGSHDLKVGYEWLDDQSKFANNGTSGPILYRDRDGLIDEIRVTDLGAPGGFGTDWTGADDRNFRHAFFLQDRWSPRDRLTISLGIRFDHQRPYYEAAIRKPVLTAIFPEATSPKATILSRNTVAPRVGFSYDLTGQGNSVVKAFYGRYYYNFADRLANLNPGSTNTRDYKFLDSNGNRLFDGVHELGTLVASAGGASTRLDADLKTPYADEISVSFERQFWGESSARVAYVRKMSRDEFANFNVLRVAQYTVPFAASVTIRDFPSLTGTVQTINVFDIPVSLRGQVQNTFANVPDGDYDYDTIQVAFNKRFGGGLFVQSSFDYQWRDELRLNTSTNSPLNSDPLNIGFFLNPRPDVPNRQSSTNWQGRLMGRYVFPLEIGFAANLRVQSGWAFTRLVSIPLPNAGTQVVFFDNIENSRSEKVAILDFRLDKSFRFGRYKVSAMADLFNVLNSNAVSNFNLANGANFGKINATLDPRTAMVGFRFEF